MQEIKKVLIARTNNYGPFEGHADITQKLKRVMQETEQWSALPPEQREALEMIQHKIGRILNGNPHYADSWVDIAGYATLVATTLDPAKD